MYLKPKNMPNTEDTQPQAIEELCLKPKNMRDLLTDEPFTRKDIIHIQDPLNLQVLP